MSEGARQYFISYALLSEDQDDTALTSTLTKLGAQQVLPSQWVVTLFDTSLSDLVMILRESIGPRDRLLVVGMASGGIAFLNLIANPIEL